MTQDRPDRLDRIEAALENLQQRLDNQVEVNAELRTSVTELRTTAEALLQTVQIHQQNFEILAHETREQRAEMRELRIDVNQQRTDINQLQEFERTASAALDRIGSVLDYLVRQRNGNQE